VIFATGSPFSVFLLAAIVKRFSKGGVKLVLDYRDPWTLNPIIEHSSIRTKAERLLEKFVLRHMDAGILTTDEMRDLQNDGFKGYIKPEKLHTITNSYEYEETGDLPICRQDGFILVHAGNFYGNRGPEKFLEGLSLARGKKPVIASLTHVYFYGLYDERKLKAAVDTFGLGGMVSCKGRIPLSELMLIMKSATALLLINFGGPRNHVFLRAKFFDYLKARRPILCMAEAGALRRVVQETQAGVVVDPENVDRISDAILNLYDRYCVKETEFHPNDAETRKFTSAYTTKQLADIFNTLCIS
jgi:glycosyltransferase involved in cell wall biosynthesis